MITYEDFCVGCTSIGLSCQGNSCPNKNVKTLICDSCGKTFDLLYCLDGEELCAECVLDGLEVVE